MDQEQLNPTTHKRSPNGLAPWDAHIASIKIPVNSPIAGKTLKQLRWREKAGVNIASIHRGELDICIPQSHEQLFPYDEISIIGTDEQLVKIQTWVAPKNESELTQKSPDLALQAMRMEEDSPFVGKSIRNSHIKEQIQGIVVGVEREGTRYLNPESDWILQVGDIVWMVGATNKIHELIN